LHLTMNCCKNRSTIGSVDEAEKKVAALALSAAEMEKVAETAKETKRTRTISFSCESESESHWNSYDPNSMAPGARYGLCISAVVPRPIGVLTTVCPNSGVVNCAPFSYTGLSTHDPPIVTHGLCLQGGQKKDTLRNIESTGEWVFNVLEVDYLEQANQTSAPMPPEMSELEAAKLETLPCEIVKAPRLRQARVSMECKLVHKYEVKNDDGVHSTTIVMGRVVRFHIHDSVLQDGRDEDKPLVDLEKLQPVGRAGGITYWPVGVATKNNNVEESDGDSNVGSTGGADFKLMKRAVYPPPFTRMERRQSAIRHGANVAADGNEMGRS